MDVGRHVRRGEGAGAERLERRLLLAQATQLAIVGGGQSLHGGVESAAITVALRDASNGSAVAGSGGVVVALSSGSSEGLFLNGNNYITAITIPAGQTSATFEYEDSLAGTPTITASATGLTSATQVETISAGVDPFLKTSGIFIKNNRGAGDTVPWHGANLGGYLVMEDWMTPMDSGSLADDYSAVQELDSRFGVATEQSLISTYESSWITTTDLDNIKAMGMNVVRLPFWWGDLETLSGTMRSDAFAQMDWLVNQAWQRGIYTILDFHGVVGGQSTDQSTGESGLNQYWTSTSDQTATLNLWEAVAAHYKNNPAVAGYDLINEPQGAPSSAAVWSAYSSLYSGIRSVDPDHIIIMEGTYGNWDWDELPNPKTYGWTNIVYEMHEYQWNSETDPSGIEAGTNNQVTDFNNHKSWNVPDYIGEFNDFSAGSDPTSVWQYSIQQYDADNINWTTWAYKTTQNLAPDNWGLVAPVQWGTTPNLSSTSAAKIAADWSQWTTSSLFTENATLVQALGGPLGVGNNYGVRPGGTLSVGTDDGVLANDIDPNLGESGIALAASLVSEPAHGELSLNANGSFTYVPNVGYVGADSFRYRVSDGYMGSTDVATVNLLVGVSSLAAPWLDADVDAPTVAGSAAYDAGSGEWTVSGGGADIYNEADQFNFLSQEVSGDYTLTARVDSLTNTNASAKAGVMFRNDDTAGAMFANVDVTPGSGVSFEYRSATNGAAMSQTVSTAAPPQWVKLVRSGNLFSGYYSADGVSWSAVGSAVSVALNSTALAGLAVSAHDNTQRATATFDHVSVMPTFASLVGSMLELHYGTTDPIALSASGGTYTATQDGVSLSFSGVGGVAVTFDMAGAEEFDLNSAIGVPITFAGAGSGDTINVNGGTLAVGADVGTVASAPTLNVGSGAGVVFSATQHLASLTLNGTASASVAAGGEKVLVLGNLVMSGTAKLDLTNNAMVVDYAAGTSSPLATLTGYIKAGFNGGKLNAAAGLTSSSVNASSPVTALGIVDNAQLGTSYSTFEGVAVDASSVLIRYALVGDTDLDGGVGLDDFNLIASHFGSASGQGWMSGDFNYDGGVGLDDFNLLASNFGKTLGVNGDVTGVGGGIVSTPPSITATRAPGRTAALSTAGRMLA